MNTGELSALEPATPKIQDLTNQVKPKLEEETNQTFAQSKAISYRQQVVYGINYRYFVKMQSGSKENDYIHLKIYQALPVSGGQVELSSFQLGKTKDDPIVYF